MSLCSVKFWRASPPRSSRARPLASSDNGIRKWRAFERIRSSRWVRPVSWPSPAWSGQGDPTRVAAQVVSGIGFLGAGVILREGINVRGLNTAATLWCSAMVGTFAGGGYYALSLGAAVLVVVTNIAMRSAILGINRRKLAATDDGETQYTIAVTCRSTEEAHVRSLLLHALSQGGLGLRKIESEDLPESGKVCVTVDTAPGSRKDAALENIVGRLSLEPFVTAVSWEAERVNGDV